MYHFKGDTHFYVMVKFYRVLALALSVVGNEM